MKERAKEFRKRVNLSTSLKEISKIVLKNYSLGDFVSNRVVYLGYCDFSYKLVTTKGEFLVKIINKETPTSRCQSIVDRYFHPSLNSDVNCPKVYTMNNGKNLLTFELKNVEFRIFVMQFLKGENIYSSGHKILDEDLKKISRQIAYINKTDFKPTFIYDEWAIENFDKEFAKLKRKLDKNISEKISMWKKEFDKVDFEKLPKCFNHGDVVDMNIMTYDKKIYVVDFSSANFQSRISDISTSIADLCFVKNNLQQTEKNIKLFVRAYCQILPLGDYEKSQIITFAAISTIIGYLNTLRHSGDYNTKLREKYLENLKQLDQIKNLEF